MTAIGEVGGLMVRTFGRKGGVEGTSIMVESMAGSMAGLACI